MPHDEEYRIEIEPNVFYIVWPWTNPKKAPLPYWERPPPPPPPKRKPDVPPDVAPWAPLRHLDNVYTGEPTIHNVPDDLDSFSAVLVWTILRKQKREDAATRTEEVWLRQMAEEDTYKLAKNRRAIYWNIEDLEVPPGGLKCDECQGGIDQFTNAGLGAVLESSSARGRLTSSQLSKEAVASRYSAYLKALETLEANLENCAQARSVETSDNDEDDGSAMETDA